MRPALTVVLAWLFCAAAGAQTQPGREVTGNPPLNPAIPPALAALRAHYAVSLGTADRAVTGQWMASMTVLENARAAAGDYEGAARVRARREESLALMGTDDGRMPVKLTVSEVTSKGSGLTIGEAGGTATLSSGEAFLEWDVSSDFKGWYEVLLTHAVGGRGDHTAEVSPVTGPRPAVSRDDPERSAPTAGGWASFQNMSSLSRKETTVLRREIVSTGGWNAWRGVTLGRIEINGRFAKLRLTAEEAAKDGLMHFRHIELVPSTLPAPGAKRATDQLGQAREAFVRDFRMQALAAGRKYRAGLDALEQQAVRNKDNDALVRVRLEKEALTKSPETLALGGAAGSAAWAATAKLDVTDSFNCTWEGEVRREKASLTMLRPAGTAAVKWRLLPFNVSSGIYQVTIRGHVPVTGGGTATLAAFAASNTPAGPPLKFNVDPVVKPEKRNKKPEEGDKPPAAKPLELDAGKLIVGKGAETLVLTVTGLTHTDGSLMDLSHLTLSRTGDVPATKTTP